MKSNASKYKNITLYNISEHTICCLTPKLVVSSIFFMFSMNVYSQKFGDLTVVPIQGNKWEVLAVGSKTSTKLEIVSIEGLSVTKRMKGEGFEVLNTTNYIIKKGICYMTSSESYDVFAKKAYHFRDEYSPPIRCEIHKNEMPYFEEYTKTIYDLNTQSELIVKANKTHHYRGIEKIRVPAGVYDAEKTEINSLKMDRVLWHDDNNVLLKHKVRYLGDEETIVTVLNKGISQ